MYGDISMRAAEEMRKKEVCLTCQIASCRHEERQDLTVPAITSGFGWKQCAAQDVGQIHA